MKPQRSTFWRENQFIFFKDKTIIYMSMHCINRRTRLLCIRRNQRYENHFKTKFRGRENVYWSNGQQHLVKKQLDEPY